MPSLATPPDLLPKLRRATCRVVTPTGAGAGTVVGRDRLVISAAHLVRDHVTVRVEFAGEPASAADVLTSNPAADLALLRVRRPPSHVEGLPLGLPGCYTPGETRLYRVSADGGPLLSGRLLGEAPPVFKFADGRGVAARVLTTTLPGRRGDSGSAVINDGGELVAVMIGGWDRQSAAVCVGEVWQLLHDAAR